MIELLLEAERSLAVGQLDHAERLYRQVSEGDPRNAIALVGLARVVLERDDEDQALELGRRALAIDPENLAARRLVERLTTVRAYRDVGAWVPPSGPGADEPDRASGESDAAPGKGAPSRKPGLLRRILRRR